MAKPKKVATKTTPKPAVQSTADSELNTDDIPTTDDDQDLNDLPTVDEAPEPAVDDSPIDNPIQLENQVENTDVQAIVHPKVIGNVCEKCGVDYRGKWVYENHYLRPANAKDNPQKVQFCKHYNHLELKCSYCKDPSINKERTLYIYSLPEKPNVLIIVCQDYRCNVAHRKRFGLKT